MATHSSILAWEVPRTERSLAGCSLWGRRQSDTTGRLSGSSFHAGTTQRRSRRPISQMMRVKLRGVIAFVRTEAVSGSAQI